MDLQVFLDLRDLQDLKEQWEWLDLRETLDLLVWLVHLDLLVNYLSFLLRYFSKKMSLLEARERSVETRVPVLALNRTKTWI